MSVTPLLNNHFERRCLYCPEYVPTRLQFQIFSPRMFLMTYFIQSELPLSPYNLYQYNNLSCEIVVGWKTTKLILSLFHFLANRIAPPTQRSSYLAWFSEWRLQHIQLFDQLLLEFPVNNIAVGSWSFRRIFSELQLQFKRLIHKCKMCSILERRIQLPRIAVLLNLPIPVTMLSENIVPVWIVLLFWIVWTACHSVPLHNGFRLILRVAMCSPCNLLQLQRCHCQWFKDHINNENFIAQHTYVLISPVNVIFALKSINKIFIDLIELTRP